MVEIASEANLSRCASEPSATSWATQKICVHASIRAEIDDTTVQSLGERFRLMHPSHADGLSKPCHPIIANKSKVISSQGLPQAKPCVIEVVYCDSHSYGFCLPNRDIPYVSSILRQPAPDAPAFAYQQKKHCHSLGPA